MRLVLVILVALGLATGLGCSFSKSSGSISDSISSPSKSISKSSDSSGGKDGGDKSAPETPEDTAAYSKDVAQLAFTYAMNGGDIGAFRTAVSKLASRRGITNWEVDPTTCTAIGKGVARAGMSAESFALFSKDLFGDDLTKQTALRKGYQRKAPGLPATSAAPPAATSPPEASPESAHEGVDAPAVAPPADSAKSPSH